MYDITSADRMVADRLQEAFRGSSEAGWNMVNDAQTWSDGASWFPVRQELIRRGILFACSCGYESGTSTVPFCDCEHFEDYERPESDDYGDEEECPDGCGQPAYACTCAELESLNRHNAEPATRGSYWTA